MSGGSAAANNVVSNGDFESGSTDWTTLTAPVAFNQTFPGPLFGGTSLFLAGSSPPNEGAVSQTISVVQNQTYNLQARVRFQSVVNMPPSTVTVSVYSGATTSGLPFIQQTVTSASQTNHTISFLFESVAQPQVTIVVSSFMIRNNAAVDEITVGLRSDASPPEITAVATSPAAPVINTDLTFSEHVFAVDAGDFSVTNGSVTAITGSGNTRRVSVTPNCPSTPCTVSLSMQNAPTLDLIDASGNVLTASPSGNNLGQGDIVFAVPLLGADLTSITRNDPNPTNADTVAWTVSFASPVVASTFTSADLEIAELTGETIAVDNPSGDARTFVVTASGGDIADFNGVVTLAFASGADIRTPGFNVPASLTPTGANENTYTLDNDAGGLTSITRQNPTDEFTNADALTFRVTFAQTVTNITDGATITPDFGVTGPTTATVTNVAQVAGEIYDVTVSGGDLAGLTSGTIGLQVLGSNDIQDAIGNPLASTTPTGANQTYSLDNEIPTVTISADVTVTGPFTATFTFSEPVTDFDDVGDVVVTNATVGAPVATADPLIYTALITPIPGGVRTVTIDVPANVAIDASSNGNAAAAQVSVNFVDQQFVKNRTERLIKNFMAERIDLIASNDPDLSRRLDDGGGEDGGGAQAASLSGGGELDAYSFTFRSSLRQIARKRAAER